MLDNHKTELMIAFVQGAKWWEHSQTNFTMWPSDQKEAFEEATKRIKENTLGVSALETYIKNKKS